MKFPANVAPFSYLSDVVVVFVALVLCAPIAWGWHSFQIIFTSFPYKYNSKMLDAKVDIFNNTDNSYLSIALDVHEDIVDLQLKYAIAFELKEGIYSTQLNSSVNFCDFLKKHSMEPALSIVYPDLLKQGNFMERCPIKKGNYSVHKYRLDEELLPSFVPEVSFFVDIKLSKAKGEFLFDGKLHGKLDKSKAMNNLKLFSLG